MQKCLNRFFHVKAVVAAYNQEKALVGAFSVIVQLHRWIDLRHYLRWGLVTASLTCVGPRPLLQTHGHVRITEVGAPRRVRGVAEKTRGALHPLHHDFIWNKSELKLFSLMSTFIKCSFNKWMWLGPSVEHFPLQFVCFCMYWECDALAVYYSKIN